MKNCNYITSYYLWVTGSNNNAAETILLSFNFSATRVPRQWKYSLKMESGSQNLQTCHNREVEKAPFHPIPILQTLIKSSHDFYNNRKQKLYKKIKSAWRSWKQGKWEEGTKIKSHHHTTRRWNLFLYSNNKLQK